MKHYTKVRKNRTGKELSAHLYCVDISTGLTYIFENGDLYKVIDTVKGELPFSREFMRQRPQDNPMYKELETRFIKVRRELNHILKV